MQHLILFGQSSEIFIISHNGLVASQFNDIFLKKRRVAFEKLEIELRIYPERPNLILLFAYCA